MDPCGGRVGDDPVLLPGRHCTCLCAARWQHHRDADDDRIHNSDLLADRHDGAHEHADEYRVYDAEPHAYANQIADPFCTANGDAHVDADPFSDADALAHFNVDGNRDPDADLNGDGNGHGDAAAFPNCNAMNPEDMAARADCAHQGPQKA